jgi:hypothetical protein
VRAACSCSSRAVGIGSSSPDGWQQPNTPLQPCD